MTHRLAIIRTCEECPHCEVNARWPGEPGDRCLAADRGFRHGQVPPRIPSWCPLPPAAGARRARESLQQARACLADQASIGSLTITQGGNQALRHVSDALCALGDPDA